MTATERSDALSAQQDRTREPFSMCRLTGALTAVAALLAGAAVAVLVSDTEHTVRYTTTVAGSLFAVIVGAIAARQTTDRGNSGRGLGIASLVVGILGLALWLAVAASSL